MNSSNQWKVGEAMFCLQSEGLKVHGPSLRSCFSFVTWQDSEEDPKSLREDKDIGKERTLILNDCAAENTQPYPLPILISFLLIFMSIHRQYSCKSRKISECDGRDRDGTTQENWLGVQNKRDPEAHKLLQRKRPESSLSFLLGKTFSQRTHA